MSGAMLMAAAAGVCAVLAGWDALVAAERARLPRSAADRARRAWPALRAGREPLGPERRRLALVSAGSLLGAGWLVAGPWPGLALAAAGPALAQRALAARRRRRRGRLVEQAPDVATAIADALAAGHSIHGSIGVAAGRTGPPPPARDELRAAAGALALGEPADAVLEALARRVDAPAYDVLVAAMLLQREAGGDLAGLLRDLAATLRAGARATAEARSATAQARFTATLVAGMPMGGLGIVELIAPGSAATLVAAPLPALMTGVAVVLQLGALAAVRRISRAGELR